MDDLTPKAKRLAVAGATLAVALFCMISVHNQLRVTAIVAELGQSPDRVTARLRVAAAWVAGVTVFSHLALCFVIVALIVGFARIQGVTGLRRSKVVAAVGLAHIPLVLWAAFGAHVFASQFSADHLESVASSIQRVMMARPVAYFGATVWLIVLSGWQLRVGLKQAATLVLPSVLAVWTVLSIVGMVTNAAAR